MFGCIRRRFLFCTRQVYMFETELKPPACSIRIIACSLEALLFISTPFRPFVTWQLRTPAQAARIASAKIETINQIHHFNEFLARCRIWRVMHKVNQDSLIQIGSKQKLSSPKRL